MYLEDSPCNIFEHWPRRRVRHQEGGGVRSDGRDVPILCETEGAHRRLVSYFRDLADLHVG